MPEDHVCDACRPIREERDALRAREERGDPPPGDESYGAARFRLDAALDVSRRTLCEDREEFELPEYFRPGGDMRYDYEQHRVETACAPCAEVAEVATIMEMWRHKLAADVQEMHLAEDTGGAVDPERYSIARDQLWAYTVRAEEALKLLRRCEAMHCADPLAKAAEDLGDAIEGSGPWTETPEDPKVEPPPLEPAPSGGGGLPWKILLPLLGLVGVLIVIGVVTIGGGADDPDTTTTTRGQAATPTSGEAGGTGRPATGGDVAGAFRSSPAAAAAQSAIAGRAEDPDGALDCVADGLDLAGASVVDVEAMADPDVSTWPSGLADLYAAVLEVCAPLEPYYLGWFGSYDFQDDSCVRTMTDYVLADYSWRRFLDEGILDDDLRPQLQAEFDAFVTDGYGANACFAG